MDCVPDEQDGLLGCPDQTHDGFDGRRARALAEETIGGRRKRRWNVELVLKATKVDGVYTDDPKTHPEAVRYQDLTRQPPVDLFVKDMLHMNEKGYEIWKGLVEARLKEKP